MEFLTGLLAGILLGIMFLVIVALVYMKGGKGGQDDDS